tara:strand:- start:473 stop:1096 length:624 start_codon:yes stop_codon:yes gene_type:complete
MLDGFIVNDMDRFEEALYREASIAFEKIVRKYNNDIYTIGFYHFGGWDCVSPMFNTIGHYNACSDQAESGWERLACKWIPSEFVDCEPYSADFVSCVNEIQRLQGEWDEPSEDTVERWGQTLDTMCRVLMRLDDDGVFSEISDRSSFVLQVGTYDESYQAGYKRILTMNPQDAIARVEEDFFALIEREIRIEKEAKERIREIRNSRG